jgi:hypothetical protein
MKEGIEDRTVLKTARAQSTIVTAKAENSANEQRELGTV